MRPKLTDKEEGYERSIRESERVFNIFLVAIVILVGALIWCMV